MTQNLLFSLDCNRSELCVFDALDFLQTLISFLKLFDLSSLSGLLRLQVFDLFGSRVSTKQFVSVRVATKLLDSLVVILCKLLDHIEIDAFSVSWVALGLFINLGLCRHAKVAVFLVFGALQGKQEENLLVVVVVLQHSTVQHLLSQSKGFVVVCFGFLIFLEEDSSELVIDDGSCKDTVVIICPGRVSAIFKIFEILQEVLFDVGILLRVRIPPKHESFLWRMSVGAIVVVAEPVLQQVVDAKLLVKRHI